MRTRNERDAQCRTRRLWLTGVSVSLTLLLVACSLTFAGPKATRDDIREGRERLENLLAEHDLEPDDVETYHIEVFKEDRELHLFADGAAIGVWDIGLGWEPRGDKEVEGDGRTPVGTYRIVTRHTSKFHLFLGINYPAEPDVEAGLEDERIDESTARRIKKKLEAGERPPWSTELGGAIGIHGGGSAMDWTAGCIAVDDDIIELIYAAARHGTRVEIHP